MNTEVTDLFEGISNATLTAYIQDSYIDNKLIGSRPAVIICPGGAFIGITEKEAEPVALRFLSDGYNAFVLRYSIGAGFARFPAPFADAAKAVMIVRRNAERWCIDPDKISLCGFSTGGLVAAVLGATWKEDYLARALNADNQLFKPNALVLGYPLLDMQKFKEKGVEKSQEMQVLQEMIFSAAYGTISPGKELMDEWNCINRITSCMPPTFLWTTSEDALVDVEECLDFVKVLAKNNISYEFHIFEKGPHGLSLGGRTAGYSGNDIERYGNARKWVNLALGWLNRTLMVSST